MAVKIFVNFGKLSAKSFIHSSLSIVDRKSSSLSDTKQVNACEIRSGVIPPSFSCFKLINFDNNPSECIVMLGLRFITIREYNRVGFTRCRMWSRCLSSISGVELELPIYMLVNADNNRSFHNLATQR